MSICSSIYIIVSSSIYIVVYSSKSSIYVVVEIFYIIVRVVYM
jgi:hypothetical protein